MNNYVFTRTLDTSLEEAEARVRAALQEAGFGVLTEIDVRETLKKKLDVDFRPYKILGACNPPAAHRALEAEPHIGVMLPCNVVLQDAGDGRTEVVAVDPVASMSAVDNDRLADIAADIRERLRRVVESL